MHGHHQGVLQWACISGGGRSTAVSPGWAFGGAVCRPVCGVFTRCLSVPPFLKCLLQSLEQLEVMLSFFLSMKRLWRDTFNFNAWALAILKLFSKNGRCFANENKALSLVLLKILLLSLPFAKESDFSKSVSKQIYVMTPPSLPLSASRSHFFFFNFSVCRAFWGAWEKSVRDHGVGMRTGGVSSGSWFLRFRWSVNLEVLQWKPQMTGAVFKSLMLLTRTGHTLWAAEFASEWDCWTLDQWCDSSCICLF